MLSNQFAVTFVLFHCALSWSSFHSITCENGNHTQLYQNFSSLAEALQSVEQYILKFNETYNFPSLTFGISVRGKPVWQKAWGLADLENYVPAQVTTRYRIASVSKTFTATVLGTLLDRGLIALDDPISRYLNESTFPSKQWQGNPVNITIRQLLSHTAGTHLTDVQKDFVSVQKVQRVEQMLHSFKNEPLLFKPGSNFAYSNYGFQLLGAMIESVTGKPFTQVLNEFLHSHQLDSSYTGDLSVVLHNTARHYMSAGSHALKDNVPSVLEELIFLNGYWPSGGVISNVPDLLQYGHLLIDAFKERSNHSEAKPIVSTNTLKQLWTGQARNIPDLPFFVQFDYGLGWFVSSSNNSNLRHQHMVGHQGGLPGVSSMLLIYPDEEIVGVALTNKGGVLELDQMIVYAVENLYHLVK